MRHSLSFLCRLPLLALSPYAGLLQPFKCTEVHLQQLRPRPSSTIERQYPGFPGRPSGSLGTGSVGDWQRSAAGPSQRAFDERRLTNYPSRRKPTKHANELQERQHFQPAGIVISRFPPRGGGPRHLCRQRSQKKDHHFGDGLSHSQLPLRGVPTLHKQTIGG